MIIDVSTAAVDPHAAMFNIFLLLLSALISAFRNRADLVLEILALRQQLAAFALSGQRPRVTIADRWFRDLIRQMATENPTWRAP